MFPVRPRYSYWIRLDLSGFETDASGGWRGIVLDQEPGGRKRWLPMGLILLYHDGANTIHSIPGVDGIPGWHHIVSNHETGQQTAGKVRNAYSPEVIAVVVSNEIPSAQRDGIAKHIGVHDRAVRSRATVRTKR